METLVEEKVVWKCRYCKAGKRNDPADPLYCSGRCRGLDGAEPLGKPVVDMQATEALVIAEKVAPNPEKASYEDYIARPYAYHRRLGAERLNWGEHLDGKQLLQAGLKTDRVAIPGDWDFVEPIQEAEK